MWKYDIILTPTGVPFKDAEYALLSHIPLKLKDKVFKIHVIQMDHLAVVDVRNDEARESSYY